MGLKYIILFLYLCLGSSFAYAEQTLLKKVTIPDAQAQHAVCMDGSSAVYYISQQKNQNNWLIMLGGGVPCGTLKHCERTLESKVNMTSSKARWKYIKGKGLLSSDQSQNPSFANWNKVFIPQCSMDVWVGKQKANAKTHNLAFQGGSIVHATIQTLKESGLKQTDNLLMVGNSAGGIGVMNHIDWITSQLPNAKVKGLTDGSWILDTQPFPSSNTIHHDILTRFSKLSMHVDDDCAKAYPKDAWRCIMGEYVYPYIQSPVFVRTSQTDPVHLRRLGVSRHPSPQQNTYIQNHAANICQSLVPVNNFFSLQGTPHTVVKNNRVFSLSYQGQSFYDAIVQFMHQPKNNLKITDCSQKAEMGNTH